MAGEFDSFEHHNAEWLQNEIVGTIENYRMGLLIQQMLVANHGIKKIDSSIFEGLLKDQSFQPIYQNIVRYIQAGVASDGLQIVEDLTPIDISRLYNDFYLDGYLIILEYLINYIKNHSSMFYTMYYTQNPDEKVKNFISENIKILKLSTDVGEELLVTIIFLEDIIKVALTDYFNNGVDLIPDSFKKNIIERYFVIQGDVMDIIRSLAGFNRSGFDTTLYHLKDHIVSYIMKDKKNEILESPLYNLYLG